MLFRSKLYVFILAADALCDENMFYVICIYLIIYIPSWCECYDSLHKYLIISLFYPISIHNKDLNNYSTISGHCKESSLSTLK